MYYGRALKSITNFQQLSIGLACALLLADGLGHGQDPAPIRLDVNQVQAPIRVDVNLVNVTFSVRDGLGASLPDLNQADFDVLEDGVAQKISFFGRRNDVPLTLGLIVDGSGSQDSFSKQHHRDLEEFLSKTMETRDRAFLVGFGNHVRLLSDFSASPAKLMAALHLFEKGSFSLFTDLGPPERRVAGTAFYDAIYYPVTEKMAAPGAGRKALLIFSDGEDNSSAHNLMDALESAQTEDVLIFALRYTETRDGRLSARNKYGISVMDRLTLGTGGAHFDARQGKLAKAFADIAEQLRSSYEIGYHASNTEHDAGFRKITIRCHQPGTKVRVKTGYFAK
jgi:Ca-activated chloride channel homolog